MAHPLDPRGLLCPAILFACLFAAACESTHSNDAPAIEVSIAAPAVDAKEPVALDGLHNLVTYFPDMVCGGVPEGLAGLHSLAAMGIRTVLSVDGTLPDAEAAESLGLHYVHLPIPYSGITEARRIEIAQALSSVPKPVYVHCHHGKHRSAAALGSATVLMGLLTPEQAMARMQVSGTAKDYAGLWESVRSATPLDPARLHVDPNTLPRVAKVNGMVATMTEIDNVFDNVKAAQKAQWTVPGDHPDLVPAKETKRLAALFDQLTRDAESKDRGADFSAHLDTAVQASRALDLALRSADPTAASAQFAAVAKSCKECHQVYRDR